MLDQAVQNSVSSKLAKASLFSELANASVKKYLDLLNLQDQPNSEQLMVQPQLLSINWATDPLPRLPTHPSSCCCCCCCSAPQVGCRPMALRHSYLSPPLLAAKYQFARAAYLENHLLPSLTWEVSGKVLGAKNIPYGCFLLERIWIRYFALRPPVSDIFFITI